MAMAQLPKTNMTENEVVPDTRTEGHDPRYWCLPPMREDPNAVIAIGGGYEFHLVAQGRQVGVWRNWTVAQRMVSGFPNASHRGHHTWSGCVAEWQAQCQLGVHPHPVEPTTSSLMTGNSTVHEGSTLRDGRSAGSVPTIQWTRRSRRSSSMPPRQSSRPHPAASASHAAVRRYFAIFGAGVVYSKDAARAAFDDAVDEGDDPELLSTDDWNVALAFVDGDC
ncbi:hypothetical protein C8F04DRAFT_1197736 [Mycena alexandri]|uniref:Ribonuclease H1 N-terminal domain-containing protein n=1 Tax=Mycena alexandri TaxID=1745969 RepID=A0AAD6WNL5_9AGAR|nr:hypothetical protein C8F04DRAFT_1197736 [Mycena alexandri]